MIVLSSVKWQGTFIAMGPRNPFRYRQIKLNSTVLIGSFPSISATL
uniref:Uncharacterized protein n=1 Tax=Anguilla anguilla TaxID=7936 RepID=A0A0E9V7F1_ANGAN